MNFLGDPQFLEAPKLLFPLLAIDPGTTESAFAILGPCPTNTPPALLSFGKEANDNLLDLVASHQGSFVIEGIKSYGMPIGDTTIITCYWIGRFIQTYVTPKDVVLLPRKTITTALCNSPRAKDSNIRAEVINRFGGPASTKKGASLYGVSRDMWSAIAIGLAHIQISYYNQVDAKTKKPAAIQDLLA